MRALKLFGDRDTRLVEVADRVERDREAILDALRQREQGEEAMRALIDELERDLDADVVVHPRVRGRRLGPPHPRPDESSDFVPPPPLTKAEFKYLRRGQPIVRRHQLEPPEIGLPLFADRALEAPPGQPGPPPPGEIDDDEDVSRLEGDLLDLEPVLRDTVVLALPFQPLCRENCPGLCAECGARLADDPGHAHEEPIDPRWAGLSQVTAEMAGGLAPATDDDKRADSGPEKE